jgi:hypothetical protein
MNISTSLCVIIRRRFYSLLYYNTLLYALCMTNILLLVRRNTYLIQYLRISLWIHNADLTFLLISRLTSVPLHAH